jgi:hypothetical protein
MLVINSGENCLPHIGFNFPFRLILKSGLCLKPKLEPAVGELLSLSEGYRRKSKSI